MEDPRYLPFVERYHHDPLRFAVEARGFIPSQDQISLFAAIKPMNAKVSVVSGTGTGKTASYARIALWHFFSCPLAQYDGKTEIGSNTYIGAPVIQQVADGVWKEMQDIRIQIAAGPHAWLLEFFEITKTQVVMKSYESQWFINRISLAKGQSVAIAGKHRFWQLIIVDEAAGVPDEHFDVIDGTQTQPGNRTLLASQGVTNTGRFYDSHHSLSSKNGGSWTSLRFNSEYSPFVTKQWLLDREQECGGRNSVEYKIHVLGLFAFNSSNYLLSREDIEACFQRGRIIEDDEPYGYLVVSDVAAGEYRDDSVIWVARIVGCADHGPDAVRIEYMALPLCSNEKKAPDLAGDLINVTGEYSNATLCVDAGGLGAGVCQLIERDPRAVPLTRINWGKPCFKNEYKMRFYNQRAGAMVRFRDAAREGRVSILVNLDQRLREKIIDEVTRLPYSFAEAGSVRYKMMSKDEMRKMGIKSPDLIDGLTFPFVEGITYMAAEEAGTARRGETDYVLRVADEAFADIPE